MFFFYFLAAFLITLRLRKVLQPTPLIYKWKTTLTYSGWAIIVLFAAVQGILEQSVLSDFIGAVVLLGIVGYIKREPDFEGFDFYVTAHYPLIAVAFIDAFVELIAPKFYDNWDKYFHFTVLIAFAWIYARWVNSKKQRQELLQATLRNNELDRLVGERTAELTKQKNELQDTVKLLQATQAQLIQQEKLASLGELTAGIAHEIQNPLNFVNNFSEVSIELIEEMAEELERGDTEEVAAIASDIKQNLEKIIFHGKRADGIVKGMLQHSRAGNNTKEATNINTLADEYLRLAYHGLRAKDKSFNANLVTAYAENLPTVEAIPQDIGRVLLNLFTNAFYAVHQKQKALGDTFKPEVSVTTQALPKQVCIKVRDNGTGIPNEIRDKILQPFFTTKPTGEGTGLGLSISYDIIVKAHGGKIDIDSKEGEYTEFTIMLPA